MPQFKTLKSLVLKHKYKLVITYSLFCFEMLGSLLRFYFFGEAINGLIKGSYNGLIILTAVHFVYITIGIIRHKYDTRTYTSIYTSLVTRFLSRLLQWFINNSVWPFMLRVIVSIGNIFFL